MRTLSKHVLVTLTAATVSLGWVTAPAHAAVPANDTVAGAVVIGALPFTATVDTADATSDALDATLNEFCGAPATNSSVWYSYTATEGVNGLVVDASASDRPTGLVIAHADGAGYAVDNCGPDAVGTPVVVGVTYSIAAFSYQVGVPGATVRLRVDAADPATVSATVSPKGKVDRAGNALISGTYSCSNADFISIDTTVTQAVGRFAISGSGYTGENLVCDGLTHAWSTVVHPDNGKFAGGKAASVTFAYGCGVAFCADSYVEQSVRLSK